MKSDKKIRFNGMDLFIVIILVIAIAAGAYLMTSNKGTADGGKKNVDVNVLVELQAMEKGYEDAIKVGDIVMIGEKDKMKLTIENVEASPAKTIGYDVENGKAIMTELPGLNDIKIELSAIGVEEKDGIKIDALPIKVGQNAIMFGKGWSGSGYVLEIDAEEK